MMLTKLPRALPEILDFIDSRPQRRWATRDRAIYALRPLVKTRHIVEIKLCDILNADLSIKRYFVTQDGTRYDFDQLTRDELKLYLNSMASMAGTSLDLLPKEQALFVTQKEPNRGFSANTLQQAFSAIDKNINLFFSKAS